MEDLLDEISKVGTGAQFRRSDLHIHSFGAKGSPDVTDKSHTPQKIVDAAVAEGLQVISITDHNSVNNVAEAIQYAADKDILVVPGVELSTTQGHLLLYAPTTTILSTVIARLEFSEDMCTNTMVQCLDKIKEFGGFGIAAHIDKQKGLEGKLPGYGEDKKQLFLHPDLMGVELNDPANLDWYTTTDTQEQRRSLVELRRKALSEANDYNIAHVSFSDAHELGRVGRNASGDERSTRIKMDSLTFDSLKMAFCDPAARIRSEEQIPNQIPRFIGMKIDGGFLDEQIVSFNSNLTCIIGGRGTGKSTLLESLRAASGNPSDNSLVDSEVWPERISLVYQDEAGLRHLLSRERDAGVVNINDPIDGIVQVLIESYGQGDTAKTIRNSDKDAGVLLTFLDEFVDVEEERQKEDAFRENLLSNQSDIEALELEVRQLPDIRRRYANANTQLRTLRTHNAEDLIKHEQALVQEKIMREEISQDLDDFKDQITSALTDKQLLDRIKGLELTGLLAGKKELGIIQDLIKLLDTAIDTGTDQLNQATEPVLAKVQQQLNAWKVNESQLQQKISQIREGLEKRGIQLDYTFIRKVVVDSASYAQKITDLANKERRLRELKQLRAQLIRDRASNRSAIFAKRISLSRKLNAVFAETVDDYQITIKYREGLHSPELRQILLDVTGWRTNQMVRANLITDSIQAKDLIEMARTGNTSTLESLQYENGEKAFTAADARDILARLSEPSTKFRLERCKSDDRPSITVSKDLQLPDGKVVKLVKDFGKLSLGQQQSVVLTILLFSESTVPLIIDQPEDDLDSEFIYKTLVKNLRRVKERRQVILVTHNANIAVLGDAELILPLRASSDKSEIRDRGSIDNGSTKDLTCTILEGSKEAFLKRKKLYNLV